MTQEEKIFIEQILDRISDAIIIEPSINIRGFLFDCLIINSKISFAL